MSLQISKPSGNTHTCTYIIYIYIIKNRSLIHEILQSTKIKSGKKQITGI